MNMNSRSLTIFLACLAGLAFSPFDCWSADIQHAQGQTVYVPAYSHVLTGPRSNPYNLAITLSIRNTDPATAMVITAIDYHDHNGRLIRRYAASPVGLAPLASSYVHLEEKDTSGGFAPKFIVRWESPRPVTHPVIEAVMIGATSGQGISFVSQGQVIQER